MGSEWVVSGVSCREEKIESENGDKLDKERIYE